MLSKKITPIALLNLINTNKFYWVLVATFGVTALSASIGLLSTSGWFITTTAIAGLLHVKINYLLTSVLIRALALSKIATRYMGNLVSHDAVLHLLNDLRIKVFVYLSTYRSKLHNNTTNSIIIMHRLAIDINRLDLFPLRFILPWVSGSIIIVLVLVSVYCIAPALILYFLPAILASWLVIPLLSYIKGMRLAKAEIILSEYYKERLVQSLSLLTPLLIWQTWSIQAQKLYDLDIERLQKNLARQNFISSIKMLQDIALAMAVIGSIWQGVLLVHDRLLTVPWLLGMILGMMGLIECLSPLADSSTSLGLSMFAKNRINELVNNNKETIDKSHICPQRLESLELIDVTGCIPNALNGPKHVSFKLETSDILCIRGPSGVGKTTLLDLIAQEITPTKGQILLNNQIIDHWNLKNTIGYLQQDIDIFDFTLAQNLRIGKSDASDNELWQVLNFVSLDIWAKSRQGLDTQLGEYGVAISGGQARRIALARLLLANRSLLLLDEPFAGLDNQNIELLYKRLIDYAQDKIILIASHCDLSVYGCQEYWLKSKN